MQSLKKIMKPLSNNAVTARSGFQAERITISDPRFKAAYETYFKKTITDLKVVSGEKYDIIISFSDGTNARVQNKKIESLGGRGDSFDRRKLGATFENQFIRQYLTLLSLIRDGKRQTHMTPEQKTDFIALCNKNLQDIKQYLKKTFMGEAGRENQYWSIMKTDKTFTNIELYMVTAQKFYEYLENRIKIDISLKSNGTCLSLSPDIYLQRKGGEKTDKSPNDIQAKLKIDQNILNIFERLPIV
jgi:hypothetical protein